jgi:excisionase family DNA binding protein
LKTATTATPAATESQTTKLTPRLLTIKAAAAYLSVAVWAIRELVWSKELRAIRIGRRFVISRDDLDAFINRKLAEAAA